MHLERVKTVAAAGDGALKRAQACASRLFGSSTMQAKRSRHESLIVPPLVDSVLVLSCITYNDITRLALDSTSGILLRGVLGLAFCRLDKHHPTLIITTGSSTWGERSVLWRGSRGTIDPDSRDGAWTRGEQSSPARPSSSLLAAPPAPGPAPSSTRPVKEFHEQPSERHAERRTFSYAVNERSLFTFARGLQGGRGCSTPPTGCCDSEGPGRRDKKEERKKGGKKSAVLIWEEGSATRPVLVNRIHPSRRAVRPRRAAITSGISHVVGQFFRPSPPPPPSPPRPHPGDECLTTEFLNPFVGHMSQRKNVGRHLSARPRSFLLVPLRSSSSASSAPPPPVRENESRSRVFFRSRNRSRETPPLLASAPRRALIN
jgi:hypothetical protein